MQILKCAHCDTRPILVKYVVANYDTAFGQGPFGNLHIVEYNFFSVPTVYTE